MPLERYLRRAFPMANGAVLRAAVKSRSVKVNAVRGIERVNGGDELLIYVPDAQLVGDIECIFQCDDAAILLKPQGLPTDSDGQGIGEDTLYTRAKRAFGINARLVHRLDTGTGGLIAVALNDDAEKMLVAAFKARHVHKEYVCIVRGTPAATEGVITAALGRGEMVTRYRVAETLGECGRVVVNPETGRTHQIRMHMAHIGHPILGDDTYGDRALNQRHGTRYQRLWCQGLRFENDAPEGLREKTFHAPAPF